ncbi:DUF2243 domain-containing protein [Neobacillus sp. Marseille-QA0830]
MAEYFNQLSNPASNKYFNRNLWSGFLFGIGLISFLDAVVFHQLLHWHHFYDKSTTAIGLVSDGFFHAFSWLATVGALFMIADLRRCTVWVPLRWTAGVFLGAGLFNLYDGTIQHKLMKLHQIRYNVDILPYDMAWHIVSGLMIIIGISLFIRSGRKIGRKGASSNG